jgi:hypothetical protein
MSHRPGTSLLPSGVREDTTVIEGASINPEDATRFLLYGSQLSYTIKINRLHASGTNSTSLDIQNKSLRRMESILRVESFGAVSCGRFNCS